MALSQHSNSLNSDCTRIQKKPLNTTLDKEFYDALAKDYRVLPLFEKRAFDYNYMRHYSFKSNELLACRWKERVGKLGEVVDIHVTKEYPNVNDYHFHNCRNQFLPSQSARNYPAPHYRLTPGPGVDKLGQKPIPVDMVLRKSEIKY